MALNIEQTLTDMQDAVASVVSEDWPGIKSCVAQAFVENREMLQAIAAAYDAGDLNDEDLAQQLADQETALETAMLACRVPTRVMAQNAANAAIEAFTAAIKLAV